MRIRYLEVIHAVMQAGTVRGAAALLHITQPAATRLLQQAEAHLGVALFQRVKGRLFATQEARLLFPEIEDLFIRLTRVRRVAAALSRNQGGALRVLCVPGLAVECLPAALGRWRAAFAQTLPTVLTLHSRQIADSLVLREADIGFSLEPCDHPAVMSEPIGEGRIVLVGRAGRALPPKLAQLAQGPVVMLDAEDPLGRVLQRALQEHAVEPQVAAVVHGYHLAIALAAQGFGVALVDNFTARHARHFKGLQVVPLEPALPIPVYALRPSDAATSASSTALVAEFAAELRA